MRGIRPPEPGGPEVLVVSEIATPRPRKGEALVRVEVAGVNPLDLAHRSGAVPLAKPLPMGVEGVGVVEELGPDVTGLSVGQRVAWLDQPGSYASHLVASAARLVPVPAELDGRKVAAAMLWGVMAQALVTDVHRLERGEACLLTAAEGGAARVLSQLASHLGADVYGVVADDAGADLARESGVKQAYLATNADIARDVRERTGGGGVSVVYDQVGRTMLDLALQAVRVRGSVVFYGALPSGAPRLDLRVLNDGGSLFLTRAVLWDYVATTEELGARAADVFRWLADGTIRVPVAEVLPLDGARVAHERIAEGSARGKFLLVP